MEESRKKALAFTIALALLGFAGCEEQAEPSEAGSPAVPETSVTVEVSDDVESDDENNHSAAEESEKPEDTDNNDSSDEDGSEEQDDSSEEEEQSANDTENSNLLYVMEVRNDLTTSGMYSASYFTDTDGHMVNGIAVYGGAYDGGSLELQTDGSFEMYIGVAEDPDATKGTYVSDESSVILTFDSGRKEVLTKTFVSDTEDGEYIDALQMNATNDGAEYKVYFTVDNYYYAENDDDTEKPTDFDAAETDSFAAVGTWSSEYFVDDNGETISGTVIYGTAYATTGGSLKLENNGVFEMEVGVTSGEDDTTGTFSENGSEISLAFKNGNTIIAHKVMINGNVNGIKVPMEGYTIYFVE